MKAKKEKKVEEPLPEKEEEKITQVYQGRTMRGDAKWWEKMTFEYARPLLETSMKENICFEQYGNCPDDLKVMGTTQELEDNIKYYSDKDPESKQSIIKALAASQGRMFMLICAVRMLLTALDMAIPILQTYIIEYLQDGQPNTYDTVTRIGMISALLLVIKVAKHTIWENLCYRMILVGHMAHGTLRQILFAKVFRMSTVSNKSYTQSEIQAIIDHHSGRIWSFVWELSTILECPFQIFLAVYLLYTNLGWFAFAGVFLYAFLWQVNKYKSKFHRRTWGVLDVKRDKRHNKSSECFHHAKMLKLYGWEQKFLVNINTLYDEENALEQKQQLYNKVVDFIPQLIDQLLPLIVFCSYSYAGNEITLAQIIICEGMIRRLNGNIGHVIHHFNDWENLQKSLGKVHDFYHAHELQKGVVNKDKDSELAISLKGNFSRGINLDEDEEEEEEKGSRCTRLWKWIFHKLTCNMFKKAKVEQDKKEEDKKDDDKKEEK